MADLGPRLAARIAAYQGKPAAAAAPAQAQSAPGVSPPAGSAGGASTAATGARPAAGSDWGTLEDWNLDDATQARMEAHLAGGGQLGQWQLGDRPPNYEQWSQWSQTERNMLGLPTTWELHLASDAHLNWLNGRGAWEGRGQRWNPGNQHEVGGLLGWSSVPEIGWDGPLTEFNYTNPNVPTWLQGSQRPGAPEYVPGGPYDTGQAGAAPTAPPAQTNPSGATRYRGPALPGTAPQATSYQPVTLGDLLGAPQQSQGMSAAAPSAGTTLAQFLDESYGGQRARPRW